MTSPPFAPPPLWGPSPPVCVLGPQADELTARVFGVGGQSQLVQGQLQASDLVSTVLIGPRGQVPVCHFLFPSMALTC